jgi:hypothetical protein
MLLDKYLDKMRMASRAWDENPEMKIVWLRTAERIVEELQGEILDDISTMVSNMPTYAVVNEAEIQDISDDENYSPNIQPSVLKEDLISAIKKMKHGKSSGVERQG